MEKATFYKNLSNSIIECHACNHFCKISKSKTGVCGVRQNIDNDLYLLVFNKVVSANIDPIEKKPLYHFYPGSRSYSIATPGCNFRCDWCQNWQISQMPKIMGLPHGQRMMPEEVVEQALASGCLSISYTYTEPTIFFEYSFDTAKIAKTHELKNIYVTNGFMTAEMLDMFHTFLDAANVDIKAFRDATYRKYIGGRLEPVLESCRKIKSLGIWLEITTLIVPGINDDIMELENIAKFICQDLGPETPWHISRFYPQYKLTNTTATDEKILNQTKDMAERIGLKYVYIGNVYGNENTKCKTCGQELIIRSPFFARIIGLDKEGKCKQCGSPMDGRGLGK